MNILLRTLLVGMALVLNSEGAQAQITIRGAVGCGKWVEDESKHKNLSGINFSRSWILGFLSGAASATNKDFWGRPNIDLLDNDSVFLWIDNYCRVNPLKAVDDAAVILFLERTRGK